MDAPWEHPDWYDLHDTAWGAGSEREPEHYRELGLALWEGHEAMVDGIALSLCARRGNRLLTLNGLLRRPAVATDVRLLSERWMAELEQRGGRYGLQTMCEAGGMANATIIERL